MHSRQNNLPSNSIPNFPLRLHLQRRRTSNCAVVDEDAILNQMLAGWQTLARLDKPVVLLVDQLRTVPDLAFLQVLAKPLLGDRLIEMVGSAIAGTSR